MARTHPWPGAADCDSASSIPPSCAYPARRFRGAIPLGANHPCARGFDVSNAARDSDRKTVMRAGWMEPSLRINRPVEKPRSRSSR